MGAASQGERLRRWGGDGGAVWRGYGGAVWRGGEIACTTPSRTMKNVSAELLCLDSTC